MARHTLIDSRPSLGCLIIDDLTNHKLQAGAYCGAMASGFLMTTADFFTRITQQGMYSSLETETHS